MSRSPESAASRATAAMDHARLFFWTSMAPVTAGEVLQNPTETLGPTLPVPDIITNVLQSEFVPDMKTTSVMLATLSVGMAVSALHEYPKAVVEKALEKMGFAPEQVRARRSMRERLAKIAIVASGYLGASVVIEHFIEHPPSQGTALGATIAINAGNLFYIGHRIRKLHGSNPA